MTISDDAARACKRWGVDPQSLRDRYSSHADPIVSDPHVADICRYGDTDLVYLVSKAHGDKPGNLINVWKDSKIAEQISAAAG